MYAIKSASEYFSRHLIFIYLFLSTCIKPMAYQISLIQVIPRLFSVRGCRNPLY